MPATADIRYVDLRLETPAQRAAKIKEFYEEVYREAFPKSDQAEGPEVWLPLMEEDVPDDQPRIYIVLAYGKTDRILGGIIFEQYRASACWLATYIAVRPDARRRGVAAGLLSEAVRTIRLHQAGDWILLAETEDPARIADTGDRAQAEQRLRVLDRLGMRRVPINYVQPPLGIGKRALDDLFLICYTGNTFEEIPANRLAAFLAEFYAALGQENSRYLSYIAARLGEQGVLKVERLVSE